MVERLLLIALWTLPVLAIFGATRYGFLLGLLSGGVAAAVLMWEPNEYPTFGQNAELVLVGWAFVLVYCTLLWTVKWLTLRSAYPRAVAPATTK